MALAMGAIERCLELLAAEVRADEELNTEFEGSIPVFFRGAGPGAAGTGVAETLSAARRHLEWFLVEHHSPSLRGGVAERITDRYQNRVQEITAEDGPEVGAALDGALDALLRSHTGLFEIEPLREGAGVWLRDLTGFGSFALGDDALARGLKGGEVVVGRLYPAGDGVHLASPAAAVLDGRAVTGPLQRDLERIRGEGARSVVRVSQAQLEAMFFASRADDVAAAAPPALPVLPVPPGATDSAEDAEAAARKLLRAAGFDDARAERALARLARHPRDPERLVHGGSDVFGALLEEVAFDTELDLDRARTALLQAWELVSAATDVTEDGVDTEPATPEAGDSDEARARAIDAFARGRAAGGDPQALLSTLESELGISSEADEPDVPAPDFPGVVGAMVDEMRWELGATEPDFDPASLEPLRHLARFARPIGVFEELRGRDLFQFATFWLQEKAALSADAEAVTLVHALRRFCEWALDAHEVDVGSEFLDALDGLETSLPRIRRANAAIAAEHRARGLEETGDLFEVVHASEAPQESFETSADRLRSSGGDELTVLLPDGLRAHLAPGDRVRGEIALTGEASVYCCYPPESAALTPG